MSDRVALRLTGEIVYATQRDGLHVTATLAHVEEKIATSKTFRIPWQASDFHNAVRFELSQQMQKMGVELAGKLADKAPTSYLDPAPMPPAYPSDVGPQRPAPPASLEPVPPLPQEVRPVRRGRPPKAPVA